MSSIYILGIETSCDETAVAVCKDGVMLSNIIASQTIHQKYGGVVPELAGRMHIEYIVPTVTQALKEAHCTVQELSAIAYTNGPGLIGSLLVGSEFAKSLSLTLNTPLIAVNHLESHIMANLIDSPKPSFPFLCLTVSGGHTLLTKVLGPLDYEILGRTHDDAVGEAFDKTAKLLGFAYPGGPLIDKCAQGGNPHAFIFPKPKIEGLDFSFSGVKTAVLYFLQKNTLQDTQFIETHKADICASIQYTLIAILLDKLEKAVALTNIKEVCIAGGVSANSGLRKALTNKGIEKKWHTYYPKMEYCTDNAAMVAIYGYYQYLSGRYSTLTTPCFPTGKL